MKLMKKIMHNAPLKVFSLILGYTFWYIFSHGQTITIEHTIPLCFYNIPKEGTLKSPETINVHLQGKRNLLSGLNMKKLAVHVDAQTLHAGNNQVVISAKKNLFLPEHIKLIHYTPAQLEAVLHLNTQEKTKGINT